MQLEYDFAVIGSGIAGVRASIELAKFGTVAVLTKSATSESNTEYAQGGIAVALNDEDEIRLHHEDTVKAGDGLCDEAAVWTLVEEGPARIEELIDWGTEFDRDGFRLSFTREAAHSRHRILHAGGDSTGREINRALIAKARSLENIRLLPHSFALQLLTDESGCRGVRFLSDGQCQDLGAQAILIATGGLGMLFRESTNPDVATGDGCRLALDVGATLADMELVQFHPTALQLEGAPHFLLSEALRGEGGLLRNDLGERFMPSYHELAELAPRDVVSRSIALEATRKKHTKVFLDLTHLDGEFVRKRFPRITATCHSFGIDITRDPIPVYPAAHYAMGGVLTDLWGRSTVPNLFAAGEASCTGVHGANRLASNSLLEGLVFGARAGRAMTWESEEVPITLEQDLVAPDDSTQSKEELNLAALRGLMTEKVGIVRQRQVLEEAAHRLAGWEVSDASTQTAIEASNMLENSRVIATAALLREESRGGHYRSDFPKRNDRLWRTHLLASRDLTGQIRFRKGRVGGNSGLHHPIAVRKE